jgi:hypothetical protein
MGAAVLVASACASSPSNPGPSAAGASDDFERAALGPNWTHRIGSNAGIVASKDFGALSFGFMSVDWTATEFGADQYSEVVIAATKDPNMLVQVHVRRQTVGSAARYGFHWNPEQTPQVWELKFDGVPTAQTRLLTSVPGAGPVAGDVLRIEARGREISGWRNGQRILVATDNAPDATLTAGGAGITTRTRVGTTVTYPAPVAASWKGGSLP